MDFFSFGKGCTDCRKSRNHLNLMAQQNIPLIMLLGTVQWLLRLLASLAYMHV